MLDQARKVLDGAGIKLSSYAAGRHYTTCPHCSAGRASKEHRAAKVLGVTIEADGGVRWGCNHCSWTGPEKGAGKKGNGRGGEGFAATYDYVGADGAPLFQKVRNAPGREPRFWLRRPDGKGGWINGTKGIDTAILYHAPDVARAIAEGRAVAVVEGEKDVNSLCALGIVATCNAHGASEPGKRPKWTKSHSEQLRGADIVVLNDNDGAGYAHADATCKLSLGLAKRVRRLDLAKHWQEIPKGGDVSDWIAAGHTGEELAALIEQAPDYVPAEGAKEETSPASGGGTDDVDAEIERLAKLSAVQYEHERKQAAERLNFRASVLDRLVNAEREKLGLAGGDDGKQGRAVSFPEIEPWPESVDGAALLNSMAHAIGRHVVMRKQGRHTTALWAVHTFLLDAFMISPRLAVRSPIMQCGKTTLLDILSYLVWRALPTANVTPAVLFRVVESHRPCLLVDEGDTFLPENDELRGIINSGHRRGGQVLRSVGDDFEPRAFATYSALAIAAIGNLPGTIADRSVIVDLKRRLRRERIVSFSLNSTGHLTVLARKAARWVADNAVAVAAAAANPKLPDAIINRRHDNWAPLFAIAKVAGGRWPQRVEAAALKAGAGGDDDEASLVEVLLGDIKALFAERTIDRMSSSDLVDDLVALEGRPWGELGKSQKKLTQVRLARMLKPLKIAPETIRIGDKTPKGYYLDQFKDAFARYLAAEGAFDPQHRNKADEMGTSDPFQGATAESDVADRKYEKSANDGPCCGVAFQTGGNEHFRIIGPCEDACVHCNKREGQVYLIRGRDDALTRPLHEACAPDWLAKRAGHVCIQCGRLGGNEMTFDGDPSVWLHRECETAYIERREREEGLS